MMVNLERLKTNAGRAWVARRQDRLVYIISNGWFWRKNRSGYTYQQTSAGIYTFSDALNASAHCGEEKGIIYKFIPVGEGNPTQDSSGKARLLLRTP